MGRKRDHLSSTTSHPDSTTKRTLTCCHACLRRASLSERAMIALENEHFSARSASLCSPPSENALSVTRCTRAARTFRSDVLLRSTPSRCWGHGGRRSCWFWCPASSLPPYLPGSGRNRRCRSFQRFVPYGLIWESPRPLFGSTSAQ